MTWHHGSCKGCGRRSEDELCGRCEAQHDEWLEERGIDLQIAKPQIHIPFDPQTDPF